MSCSRAASIASNITAAGLLALLVGAITAPARLAHSSSCSFAAARNVSPAASITVLPWEVKVDAILPIEVVLPPPFTPTMMRTAGLASSRSRVGLPADSRIVMIWSFMAWRISAGSLILPCFTSSRRPSQMRAAVATPKSRMISRSSSVSSVLSASSRFQKESSSLITLMSPRCCSRPEKRRRVRSTSAFAFSTTVRANLLKKSTCICSPTPARPARSRIPATSPEERHSAPPPWKAPAPAPWTERAAGARRGARPKERVEATQSARSTETLRSAIATRSALLTACFSSPRGVSRRCRCDR
mmetsp:Transcript_57270/g.136127  ORF Transcript_57270/g.136127 Transcript_57270/m.136127 type:complete len:301 (-) Transcript_57270:87-989(-)